MILPTLAASQQTGQPRAEQPSGAGQRYRGDIAVAHRPDVIIGAFADVVLHAGCGAQVPGFAGVATVTGA